MNNYIIPIHDAVAWDTWNIHIMASSIEDCEDKLIDYLCNYNKKLPGNLPFEDFIIEADKQNICIGEITDIEEYGGYR